MTEPDINPGDAKTWTRDYDARMRDYYGRRAPEYEVTYAKPERQTDLAVLRAKAASCFAGRRVIDVACGTGYWSALLAQSAAEVVGIDANEAALSIAREKNLQAANGAARFRGGDAYALTDDLAPDGKPFDAAFVGFLWSHVPRAETARFLASLHARLAPSARVVILDNLYVAGSSTPIAFTDVGGNTWQRRALADGSTHHVLKNFPEREELTATVGTNATATHWWRLDYYWWFEYRLR